MAWVFGFGTGSALAANAKLDTWIRTGNWAWVEGCLSGGELSVWGKTEAFESIFYILG